MPNPSYYRVTGLEVEKQHRDDAGCWWDQQQRIVHTAYHRRHGAEQQAAAAAVGGEVNTQVRGISKVTDR